jgi:hypothetical protein
LDRRGNAGNETNRNKSNAFKEMAHVGDRVFGTGLSMLLILL